MDNTAQKLAGLAAQLEARLTLEQSLGSTHLTVDSDFMQLTPQMTKPKPKPQQHPAIEPVASPTPEQPEPVTTQSIQTPETKPDSANIKPKQITQTQPQHIGSDEKLQMISPVCEQALKCSKCNLSHKRSQVIFGEGNLEADLAFITDAPGRSEDLQGRPFIGPDGELLTDIIEKGMKIPRAQVYMTSIVKCRPPGNRKPTEEEVNTCMEYLEQQLDIVKPKVIVTVGLNAANFLTGQNLPIHQLHGIWQEYKDIPVMPILNTSFLLRQRRHLGRGNDYDKQTWHNIQQVMRRLKNA